mgnify:CR=1 FL=1
MVYCEFNSQENPNILWIVCEDQSLFFSSYGDSIAKTPNIDELALETKDSGVNVLETYDITNIVEM